MDIVFAVEPKTIITFSVTLCALWIREKSENNPFCSVPSECRKPLEQWYSREGRTTVNNKRMEKECTLRVTLWAKQTRKLNIERGWADRNETIFRWNLHVSNGNIFIFTARKMRQRGQNALNENGTQSQHIGSTYFFIHTHTHDGSS